MENYYCDDCLKVDCPDKGKRLFYCNKYYRETPYTEIFKLREMLELAEIPFYFYDRSIKDPQFIEGTSFLCRCWDSFQIECYNEKGERYISVIEGYGSFGQSANMLEIMGLLKKDESPPVQGWLSAEEVFNRILEYRR